MANAHAPYHPIVYVRGFAFSQGEIEETVADPYMGFNVGSTKSRQVGDGAVQKFFFESPLVRLKDELVYAQDGSSLSTRYDDVYVGGSDLTAPDPDDTLTPLRSDVALPYQSVAVLRYYDDASQDFGDGKSHPIEHFAERLGELIIRLRTLVCRPGIHPITGEPLDNHVDVADFRVHLVAHSMGGLVCRAFLSNLALGGASRKRAYTEARSAVDKVFTYATPHNGIDLRIVRNVPGWSALGEATNFNRERMAGYLGLGDRGHADAIDVAEVRNFPADRIFNLVGTNPADYLVAKGLSAWAVGEESDGLVRIQNATTYAVSGGARIESPRAFVHRSHSGHYGIVNSEEGFQNLTRFLFGSVRVDGYLDIAELTLPAEVQQALDADRKVRAAYRIEIVATLRGSQWHLHRRTVRENSAITMAYDELFPKGRDGHRHAAAAGPQLFSLFLDPRKSHNTATRSIAFAFDVSVLIPDYQVDGVLWLKRHFEGGYLVRQQIVVEATPDPAAEFGLTIAYGSQDSAVNATTQQAALAVLPDGGLTFGVDVASPEGSDPRMKGRLRVEMRHWV